VLGLLEGADYPVNRLRLVPRDAVVLYTDGVTEAQDAAEEFFGAQRLLEVARRWGPEGEMALTEGVFAAVREFAGEAPQSDDITVLTLSYAPSAALQPRAATPCRT
jgi:sigma-B regulation protein RsbU (phosphoserine phosphatase)